ncbi:MAG: hypothetical protein RL377_939 [Bacteroidota bacterium]|jgi:hypothetical protein
MRLFLVLPTTLPVSNAVLLAHAKVLVPSFSKLKDVQLIVVTDTLDSDLKLACDQCVGVKIQTTQEATLFIRQVTNAVIVHFGAKLNWAKGFPQYFIPLLHTPALGKQLFFQRYLTAKKINKYLNSATKIIAMNEWAFSILQNSFPKWIAKIQLISFTNHDIPHFEWQTLAATRATIAADNNYFLVFAPVEKLVAILKEFSIFKKWQQTTMHLVFVFEDAQQVQIAHAKLKGYKFKDAVSIRQVDEFHLSWLGAAYAILFEAVAYPYAIWMQQAIQQEIPLFLDEALQLPSSWVKAGELFSFSEKLALSNHFKLYYKDELYRQAKASNGKEWFTQMQLQDSSSDIFK